MAWPGMSAPFVSSYPGRPVARFIPNPKLRFLDQCREVLRFKQMSPRTEKSYVDWIRRFIVWAREQPSAECGTRNAEQSPGETPGAR